MNRLQGKVALITGASAGIGEALAHRFAARGVTLLLMARRLDRLTQLAETLKNEHKAEVHVAACDVSNQQEVEATLASWSNFTIDILVNNAGFAKGLDAVYNADFDDWNQMIDVNIRGVLHLTRLVSPAMKARNAGHIINVGSIVSHDSYPGGAVYAATKHAVNAITKTTKYDLHGTKVRVSMISPGLVETEFSKVRFKGDEERAKKVYQGLETLSAMDIAEIIEFIADRPEHVNIMDAIVYPVYQSSTMLLHREA